MSKKTALITGTTGFIGSNLCEFLIKLGWKIDIIVQEKSDLSSLKHIIDKLTKHIHDGSTENLVSIVEQCKPDIVFHLASCFLATHQISDIKDLIQGNLLFSTQLLEAVCKNNVKYLINTGTSWQHYNNEDYNPVCLYAATKEAFEKIMKYYLETSDLKVITLKLFDTYGAGDQRRKLIYLLNDLLAKKDQLEMSPGDQLIDIVHIDDVVKAFYIASVRLLNNEAGKCETFAISSGHPIKLKELVEKFGAVVQKKLNISWGGRPYRNREVMKTWNNGCKLPGWRPEIGFEEGVKRLLAKSI